MNNEYIVTMEKKNNIELKSSGRYTLDDFYHDHAYAFKVALTIGLKKIPYVGSILSTLVKILWPTGASGESLQNLWEMERNEIQSMIDEATLHTINDILNGIVNSLGDKIADINRTIENYGFAAAKDDYINLISNYIIGLEEQFKFESEGSEFIAYATMPLLSITVGLQLSYLAFGLDNKANFGLDSADIDKCSRNIDEIYKDVKKYIEKYAKWSDSDSYSNANSENIYNEVMGSRAFCALNGFEHIEIWSEIQSRKSLDFSIISTSVSYSVEVGVLTPNMTRMATAVEVGPPLLPVMVDGHRNKIVKIEGWDSVEINSYRRVGCLKITYENGDVYDMGVKTSNPVSISLDGEFVDTVKVVQGDTYAINYIKFTLTDGRTMSVGEQSGDTQLLGFDNHTIAAIFVDEGSSDKISCVSVSCIPKQYEEE
ncbi:insecticidal delta-endotoxin Cry8Ea1 family protein [Shewanella violacea]|uniref:Pesticidal crystal protein domain-containing protein n=1 Tax=Shewanella violacea (strain JCM 10179 / CIP 106290 / LMG 19151 / DSS12) TaxID=637905 RepID=D4ZHH7_SHEVD|nr:insecticidal delta-endotoxin Cry8Ea1 family protein [Shewanella violacea]BAJ01126.1 hypothetical protein SVI_1155 [Shewanella violacea DSS12]